jgi:hypothetical protein
LCVFDPATRRGWNGPYLRAEAGGAEAEGTQEKRVIRTKTGAVDYEAILSATSPDRRLPILRSDYSAFAQKLNAADLNRVGSHYQLDYSDAATREIGVRFVRNPFAAADAAGNEAARLGIGILHD